MLPFDDAEDADDDATRQYRSEGDLTLKERLVNIDRSLEGILDDLDRLAVQEYKIADLDRRVTAVEGWQTWALRGIGGAIIIALILKAFT